MGEVVMKAAPSLIRRAVSADAAPVVALLGEADLPVEGVREGLATSYDVAERNGELVGVAGLEVHGGYGLLRSVAVARAARGTRTGEALVRSRLAEAARLGLERVYLLTTTAESWFPRFGFRSIGRADIPHAVEASAEFAELCPATATVMVLELSGAASGGPDAATVAATARTAYASSGVSSGDVATDAASLKAGVREKYGAAARAAAAGGRASCCDSGAAADARAAVVGSIAGIGRKGTSCCAPAGTAAAASETAGGPDASRGTSLPASTCCGGAAKRDPITDDLYDDAQTSGLPVEAVLASLGCGNPTALAELSPGEVVLDLGSGGGIDVLLSARRVGPTGRAYGLDMTDEMLELARANQERAGVDNVEFLKGDIESIPLPDASVDVVISNCVINLAADKSRVLREAFRVLRPGGRFAVSDVVRRRELPDPVRRSMELWVGCIAGALHEQEYARLLGDAGFEEVSLEPTRIYSRDDAAELIGGAGIDPAGEELDGAFMSAFVRARKPA